MAGLVGLLFLYYPTSFDGRLFPLLLFFGFLGGAGGATFSVGIPQTSYWFPARRQDYALGVYAGAGNIGPGVFNYVMPLLIRIPGGSLSDCYGGENMAIVSFIVMLLGGAIMSASTSVLPALIFPK